MHSKLEFGEFSLETCSVCNQTCPTCIRNSHPSRSAVQDWFGINYMPMSMIEDLFQQLKAMGFKDAVCLSFFNEPFADPRIVEIIKFVHGMGCFGHFYLCTNGTLLTEEIAKQVDGLLDHLVLSYIHQGKAGGERISSWFTKTKVRMPELSHTTTHFSPKPVLAALQNTWSQMQCFMPTRRLIINHRGDCVLCCEDVVGEFGLGNVYDRPLADLWFSEDHQQIIRDLKDPGGRLKYSYCKICPRKGLA